MQPYYQDSHITLFHGDCRTILPLLDAASVQCCVTSPPYFGLRDYGGDGQIGLEPTPRDYVAQMAGVFGDVWRVLREDATCWLNLGDSFCGGGGFSADAPSTATSKSGKYGSSGALMKGTIRPQGTLKPKDLIGIPWRVAFALQDAGWYLRSDIIWAKGNPMPESVTDRPTKAHEYLFLLAKAERYWYDADAIREPHTDAAVVNGVYRRSGGVSAAEYIPNNQAWNKADGSAGGLKMTSRDYNPAGRNKRSVWTINTQPYAGAHFAVFPEKLIEPCILAGCPERVCSACGGPWTRQVEVGDLVASGPNGLAAKPRSSNRHPNSAPLDQRPVDGYGDLPRRERVTTGWQPSCTCNAATAPGIVLDPFAGSGTTGRVAKRLGRRAILIEQNEAYCELAAESLTQQVFDFA
jgi:DNA modification methylase